MSTSRHLLIWLIVGVVTLSALGVGVAAVGLFMDVRQGDTEWRNDVVVTPIVFATTTISATAVPAPTAAPVPTGTVAPPFTIAPSLPSTAATTPTP